MTRDEMQAFLKAKLKDAMKIRNDALMVRLDSWAFEVACAVMDTFGGLVISDLAKECPMQRNVKMRECLEAIRATLKFQQQGKVVIGQHPVDDMMRLIQGALDEGKV